MGEIEQALNINYVMVFIGLFAVLFAIKEVMELFSFFKNKLGVKFGKDIKEETIEDRIATLERHDKWQYGEISKISKGIDDIQDELLNNRIETMRKIILDFCSALSSGQKCNKESFSYVFKTYEQYEEILEKHNRENNVISESIRFIKDKYQELLRNGEI